MPQLRLNLWLRPNSLTSQPIVFHTCSCWHLHVDFERENMKSNMKPTSTGPNFEVLDMYRHTGDWMEWQTNLSIVKHVTFAPRTYTCRQAFEYQLLLTTFYLLDLISYGCHIAQQEQLWSAISATYYTCHWSWPVLAVKRIMQEARELANDPCTDYTATPLEVRRLLSIWLIPT